MGTVISLFPTISEHGIIGNIPRRRVKADDIALGMCLERLFRHRGNKKVVITTKHGEPVLGIEKVSHILHFYREQGQINSIHLVTVEMADDLRGILVPALKATVA